MQTDGIYGNTATASTTYSQGDKTEQSKEYGMDSNMFLQLLVTQMRYQDPLSGDQDTGQMITQLAMFTLLEQVIRLQQSVEKQGYAAEQTTALNLLNRRVEVADDLGEVVSGLVTSVGLINQKPYLTVGGREYSYEALLRVKGEEWPGAGAEGLLGTGEGERP